MDIRKFFGAGAVGCKNAETKKENTKNIKDAKLVLDTKAKQSKNKNGKKSSDSKLKPKGKSDPIEDNIIIDDSSDEDVIESSLTIDKNSNKNKSSGRPKENGTKKEAAKITKQSEPKNEAKSEPGKNSKEKNKKLKGKEVIEQSKISPERDVGKRTSSKKQAIRSDNERRSSPRKGKSMIDSKSDLKSTEKLKKQNSNSSNDIVVDESSDEESPVITKKRKSTSSALKRKIKLFESDSEEEEPLLVKKSKSKRRKNGSFAVIDSDEEKKETALDKFVFHKATPNSAKEKKTEIKKTPVNLKDFFGGGAVLTSRKERATPSATKRNIDQEEVKAEAKAADIVFDNEMHDDDDFLRTLDELDGPDIKKVKHLETSPKKVVINGGGTLTSNLAAKMKSDSVVSQKSQPSKFQDASPSPGKRSTTPSKPATTVKKGKTYTMEVTKTKTEVYIKESDQSKEEATPAKTPKQTRPQKSSEKKGTDDAEDDGFGTKTSTGFRAFKMRGGPLAVGSKDIPEGEENCLDDLTFVVTGVLDSIERDDVKSLIEKYGGKVTGNISKKTSYVVIGREPGESKLKKAQELKKEQLDEDSLFELIRTLPGKTSKYEIQAKEQLRKEETMKAKESKASINKKLESFRSVKATGKEKTEDKSFTQLKDSELIIKDDESLNCLSETNKLDASGPKDEAESLLWVDKHRPTTLKQVIGQHGDKSNANKLLHWIRKWHQNVIIKGLKAAGNFFGGKGDGTGFRAALLSGPPGIGKTTTATLVCKEAGFSFVELNASDTRSKRSLKEVVAESLNNQTLVDYMGDKMKSDQGQTHCLIMDEVDGMAGNEDRGGLQELVQLIKSSKIPIICICNDRNSMKMRTLANHCFDLRFSRPRVEQIKGAMMTLAFREGLKIPPAAVQEIILASNHDIRQVIHNLSMWSVGDKQLTYEQVKSDARKAQKDMKMGPFDVCRKVFVIDDETSKMTLSDKSNLFFHDYSFGPLFVHENYPHVIPAAARNDNKKHLACLSKTIDSLCDGDLVEKLIRKEGNWNLLPIQAMYSSVIPGENMRGRFPQMTEFPSWLGKNSSKGKTERILQELNTHMHLRVSCDKRGLSMDYLPAFRVRLTSPLVEQGQDGVSEVIEMMDNYDIIKDDFDNIMEVTKWPNGCDPMAKLESKTKAAFTRRYNKGSHMTPYSTGLTGSKKKKVNASTVDEDTLLVEPGDELPIAQESEGEEDDEPAVVAKPKAKATASKGKQATGQGKHTKQRK